MSNFYDKTIYSTENNSVNPGVAQQIFNQLCSADEVLRGSGRVRFVGIQSARRLKRFVTQL